VSTGLYDIPNDWFSGKLRNMIEDLQTGFASGERDDNGIVQLRMNNITDDGRFDFEELLKVPIPSDIERFDLQTNDIIFNNTNSLDLIGKTAIVNEGLPYTFSNHLTRMRVIKNKLVPHWLYFILLRYKERFVFRAICHTHVGQSGIGKNELQNLQIFFPSLVEQQKIASNLSKVDELIQKTDQVIEQTQRLKKGLMQRLLTKGIGHTEFKKTELGDIPKTWALAILNTVCDKIQDGSHFSPKIKYVFPGENRFLYITAKNIKENAVDLSDVVYVDKQFHDSIYPRCNPEKGDILLVKDGVMTGVAVVNNLAEPFSMLSSIALIKTSKSMLDAHYLKYYLESASGFRMVTNQMTGTAIRRIILDKIKTSPIPLPPIFEQKRIGGIMSQMDKKISVLINYKTTTEYLKRGLMQKLLTGQVRVKV
jgi:type I restriction enzyme, S subunit